MYAIIGIQWIITRVNTIILYAEFHRCEVIEYKK